MTEAQRVINLLMTERQLQDNVIDLATRLNMLVYHTFDSRRSQPGFPDLVIVGSRRVLFVELKRQRGKLTDEQQAWQWALEESMQWGTRHEYYLWRPSDWNDGTVEQVLREAA